MKSSLLSICAAFLLIGTSAFAQNAISGTVVDPTGAPVIGASVFVPLTTNGVITDEDGGFAISVETGTRLEVSCIGYVTRNVIAMPGMRVVLEEDVELLEETVVIGYGSVKKSNLTSAVASMDNSSIEDRPMARAEHALQGQLAGVSVRISSAEPGADPQIHVRGTASISAGNNPLYVVDGVPQGNLQGVNPNDIASIEVLKDAASSAIYGSRGSNGVIIVTTKQGKKGRPQVMFSATYGVATLEKKIDVLNSVEWMERWIKSADDNYLAMYPAGKISDDNATRLANVKQNSPSYNGLNGVIFDGRWFKYVSEDLRKTHTYTDNGEELSLLDWQKEMYKPSGTQDYNVSIAGATDNTQYMFSLGYMDQDGLFPASNYKRINLRTNIQTKISSLFTAGLNLSPSFTMNTGSGRGNGKDSQAHRYLSSPPVSGPGVGYNVAYYPNIKYDWSGTSAWPAEYNRLIAPKSNTFRLQASTFLRFTPIKDFSVEATASANYFNRNNHTFTNNTIINGNWLTNPEGVKSSASHSTDYSINTLLQVVANYNKTFNRHHIDFMVGASSELGDIGFSTQQNFSNLANDTITGTFNGSSTTTTPKVDRSSINESTNSKLLSLFGRVQYDFAGRYMLSASLRYDGYSGFGSENKWGWFPSLSAGWMVSNEEFFRNWGVNDWWNTFKIRASYGQTGNNGGVGSRAYSTLSQTTYADELAYVIGTVGNKSIGWEHTHSTDIAMDLGFLNNRIQASIDWYTKTTTGLIYNVPVPTTSGMSSTLDNSGSIYNTGVELEFNTHNIQKNDFSWSTSFNMSYNRNEVLQLGTENTTVYTSRNGAYNVREVGQPLDYFYGLVCEGVWMNQKQIDDYAAAHNGIYPTYNGSPIKPGDLRHQDTNGDGNIDPTTSGNDMVFLGKPTPDFVFGMTNRFVWKNLDASILFTAQTGGSIYGTIGRAIDRAGMGPQTNAMGWWRDAWWSEEDPGNGKVPYQRSAVKPDSDSRFLYKSDYFRVKNLTIGYRIPFKRIINSARFFISCENLLILDNYYHGYSPEASNVGTGMDYGAYPSARTFTTGININF